MSFGARGLFSCSSINVHVGADRAIAQGSYVQPLKLVRGSLGIEARARYEDLDWRSMSETDRSAVLTLAHERDHFNLLVGTPVGLLMWRCNETLVSDIAFAMRALASLGMTQLPGSKSLLQWMEQDGEQFLASVPTEAAALAGQARRTLQNIAMLDRFKEVMFGEGQPARITVGEFLLLANQVYPYLCERWGLRKAPVWLSRNYADNDPLYPDREGGWAGTIAEIFEGSARLREREVMDAVGVDEASVANWEQAHITGIYRRSYRAFIYSFGSVDSAKFFTLISLLSPIDPLCTTENTFYVEQVLPHMRALRLSLAVSHRNQLTTVQLKKMHEIGAANGWCMLAGLEPAANTLRCYLDWSASGVGSSPFFSPILRPIGLSSSQFEKNENGRYIVVNMSKFDRGFQESLSDIGPASREEAELAVDEGETSLQGRQEPPEEDTIVEGVNSFLVTPDIEFFRDTVSLGNYYSGTDVYNYHFNMLHYMYCAVCLALLQPFRPLENPSSLVASFIKRWEVGNAYAQDKAPESPGLLSAAKANESTVEWENIRAWWSDTGTSSARIGAYLRQEIGAAALRSVRFYPSDPGYASPDSESAEMPVDLPAMRGGSSGEVHSRMPLKRFRSHLNFANLLAERAESEGDGAVSSSALAAYQFAIAVTSRNDSPSDWAVLMSNLGHTLSTIAAHRGDDRTSIAAIRAFYSALEVRTRASDPVAWARTSRLLGEALIGIGERRGDRQSLSEAIAVVEEVFEEIGRAKHPMDWARSKACLGIALARLGETEIGTTRLTKAAATFREALRVLTAERVPLEWATLQNNLGTVFMALGARENGTRRLRKAAAAYRMALTRQDRDQAPLGWALSQHNLGAVLEMIGDRSNDIETTTASVAALRAALEVRSRERFPADWAASQNSLAVALETLGRLEASESRLEEAAEAYRLAVSGAQNHIAIRRLADAGLRRTMLALSEQRAVRRSWDGITPRP